MTSPAFPQRTVSAGHPLYRIHRSYRGAEYYSTAGGRFDPPDDAAFGTLYLADTPSAAFLETLGRFRVMSRARVDERSISTLRLTTPLVLADLTDRAVLGRHGVDGAVSVGADYERSGALAVAVHEAGLDGVFYATRHDPALRERSLAVFGPRGEHTSGRFEILGSPISDDLTDAVADEFEIVVLPYTPW